MTFLIQFRAYGLCATEIADLSPQGSTDDEAFQDWTGADATSIWAAATSGRGAIAMHLLACMLARVWSASEATSIWDEIVEVRKRELMVMDSFDPLHLNKTTAAHIELTREQLSNWDASARAWLSVTDGIKRKEQTQFMFLTKDSVLPVSQKMNVYRSVIDKWTSAMITIDQIIAGTSYSVRDGAVLLGLASWHIYPDPHVLGASLETVFQRDSLIAFGGMVTFGFSTHSADGGGGVFWSLPLAYLRFYGDPVPVSRSIGETSTRLTVPDFSRSFWDLS